MAENFVFTVWGRVVGSARPRVTKFGTYIPKSTRQYRDRIKGEFITAGGMPLDGPVSVKIDVFRQLPKSRPKILALEPDTFKPDVDNIAKNVLDALNGLAWKDDSQVIELLIRKHPRSRDQERIAVEICSLAL